MSRIAQSVRDPSYRPRVPRLNGRKLYDERTRLLQRGRLYKLKVRPDHDAGAELWRLAADARASGVGDGRRLPGPAAFAWLCGMWLTCKVVGQPMHTLELAKREYAKRWGMSKSTVCDAEWWAVQLGFLGVERRRDTVEFNDGKRANWYRTSRVWATDKMLALLELDEAGLAKREALREQRRKAQDAREERNRRRNTDHWHAGHQERSRALRKQVAMEVAFRNAKDDRERMRILTASLDEVLEGRRVG